MFSLHTASPMDSKCCMLNACIICTCRANEIILDCAAPSGLLERIQQMTVTVEKLSDENNVLRLQAGVAATDGIELSGVKLAKVSLVLTFM